MAQTSGWDAQTDANRLNPGKTNRNDCKCSRKTLRQCNAFVSVNSGGKQRVQCVPNAESEATFLQPKKAVTANGCILWQGRESARSKCYFTTLRGFSIAWIPNFINLVLECEVSKRLLTGGNYWKLPWHLQSCVSAFKIEKSKALSALQNRIFSLSPNSIHKKQPVYTAHQAIKNPANILAPP